MRQDDWATNKMVLLKGLSSSSPVLLNSRFDTNEYSGGGMYLNWMGEGIVIDPGYRFVQNLHHFNINVLNIMTVVVTHEHIDHNADLRLLEDLISATWSLRKNKNKVKWFLDPVTYSVVENYQKFESSFQKEQNEIINIEDNLAEDKIKLSDQLAISYFRTFHIPIKDSEEYEKRTYGIIVFLDQHKMMYTSDTEYFEQLSDYAKDCDALILNISSIYEYDLMLGIQKKNHLGYFGCYNLLKQLLIKDKMLPKYVFISEFWNGTGDIRFDISKYLKSEIEKQVKRLVTDGKMEDFPVTHIMPAEIGIVYDIENQAIKCSVCGKYMKNIVIVRPEDTHLPVRIICKDVSR